VYELRSMRWHVGRIRFIEIHDRLVTHTSIMSTQDRLLLFIRNLINISKQRVDEIILKSKCNAT